MTKEHLVKRNQSLKSLREEGFQPNDFKSLLATSPAVWAETLTELEGSPVQLEPFQIRFLNDKSTYRIANKSRQIGFSTVLAVEVVHSACTRRNYNANIVSTTQDEAQDKLRIGDMLWASIPMEYDAYGLKPIKYRNAEDALAFHMPPYTSTIISKPGTSAIRGGKKDMYYDEAAFIKEFPKLYQAGLPAITRGEGRITVISTPMGQSGLYYDLWSEPTFSKHFVPWWESRFMVKGGNYDAVSEAMERAPNMTTEERVKAFGSDKLQTIFFVGLRGDVATFQTEYEGIFVDESEAFLPLELLSRCRDDSQRIYKEYPNGYTPRGEISIGVDLAKERDSSVFTVVDTSAATDDEEGYFKKVVYVYSTQDDYDKQFLTLKNLAARSRATRVTIDATGPGQMFYERARKEGMGPGVNVEGISFTNAKKENWATRFKGDLQTGKVSFPNHRELIAQIHGIRRTRTENGFFRFSGKRDDYFWSLMLALYGEGRKPVTFYRI